MKDDMNGIEEYEGAFDKGYCDAVIAEFENMHQRNLTLYQNSIGKNEDDRIMYDWSPGNQTYHHDWPLVEHFYKGIHEVYKEYAKKYDILNRLQQHTPKGMGIQRTSPHMGYHAWHNEAGCNSTATRLLAYTLYLNDIEEGGETEFLYHGVKIKPKTGKVAFFPSGYTYPHRGNPIYKGYKYIVTGWYTFDA
jgi:hypothetical protein